MSGEHGVGATLQEVLDEGKRSAEAAGPDRALGVYARALPWHGAAEALIAAAADAWVAAADATDGFAGLPKGERRALERALIAQAKCAASPPILHHRIAAQHSGGVVGYLGRAAMALEPTLEAMLGEGDEGPNVVLMLLLLRSGLRRIDQGRISALHAEHFARFREGDLRIPYSVVFDRVHFKRNIADLVEYVRTRGAELVGGALPVNQLLLLFWLAPAAFDGLPADWAARAVRARLSAGTAGGGALDGDEAAAARSLAILFGGEAHRALAREGSYGPFDDVMDAVAAERRALAAAASGGSEAAAARLDQRPRQALAAAWNMAAARAPAIAQLARRPRVAVCVSGQLRGFRTAWESWRPLLAGIEATVFVSSWARIGRGTPEPFRSVLPFEGAGFCDAYRAIGTDVGLEALRTRYPRLFAAFDRSGTVTAGELSDLYGTPHVEIDDEDAEAFRGFSNSDKMHYKIERCFRMAEASSAEFDLVLRMRPDKPVSLAAFDWRDMLAAAKSRPALWCETPIGVHYGALLMGDQFAIGAPRPSRLYAETWSRTKALRELGLFKLERALTGHAPMAQLCWLHRVEVRKVPVKFGPFAEAEPLGAREIGEALAADAAGRTDGADRRLIAANAADLARR